MTFNFSCINESHLIQRIRIQRSISSRLCFKNFQFHLYFWASTHNAAHNNLLIKCTYSWLNVAIIICECSNIDAISITNERLQQLLYPQQLMKIAGFIFMRFQIHCHRDSCGARIQYVSLLLD